jgi:hypothetical protein
MNTPILIGPWTAAIAPPRTAGRKLIIRKGARAAFNQVTNQSFIKNPPPEIIASNNYPIQSGPKPCCK